MIALVAFIESFIAARGLDISRPEAWEWWLSGQAARRQARDAAVLCFGSSMVKQGLIPRVIARKIQQPVYNLSLCAGPAPSSYLLLRRALESGSKPKAVLVEFHPAGLTESPKLYVDYWPQFLDFGELADLSLTTRDPGFFAFTTLARLFPSIRDRNPIRNQIQAALQGQNESNRRYNIPLRRNVLANRGAKVIPKNPQFHGQIAEHLKRTLLGDTWECHPVNLAYLERFFELAASRNIPVFWVVPPFSPSLQAERERKGLDARYREFAVRWQRRFPNVVIVDGQRSGYGDSVFVDAMHFDSEGARAFSSEVGEVLRQHLSRPRPESRWVMLPNYHEPSPDLEVEDFARTMAIINEKGTRLR